MFVSSPTLTASTNLLTLQGGLSLLIGRAVSGNCGGGGLRTKELVRVLRQVSPPSSAQTNSPRVCRRYHTKPKLCWECKILGNLRFDSKIVD